MRKPLVLFLTWGILFAAPVHHSFAGDTPSDNKPGLKAKIEKIFSRFLQRELTVEKMTWRFPLRYKGENVKLWESPGLLMAEAPLATMIVSFKTITSGRIRVSELRFNDTQAYVRYTHDGKINLVSMISDLSKFARKNYKYGQRQKVAYSLFKIENARIQVIDAETGRQPFNAPFVLNGSGKIRGLGPQTKFPFHMEAVLVTTSTPTRLDITGTMSNRPQIRIVARDIPLTVLLDYLPVVKWFTSAAHAEFNFGKAGSYIFWKLDFTADDIKTIVPLPFPTIKLEGFIRKYARSHINVILKGNSSKINVAVAIRDLITKKVSLEVVSDEADIAECIQWCRTGAFIGEGARSVEELKGRAREHMVWNVTGKGNIQARLDSVMGPDLIRKADGQINLKIREGKLVEMPGFVKALTMLNLASLLGSKPSSHDGLKFETIDGIIDIRDGVAKIRELIVLESPTLNIGLMGKIDFSRQIIDARMLVGFVSVSDKMVTQIPMAQPFTEGKAKRIVPIWLSIQGKLNDPIIRILPPKSFSEKFWNLLPTQFRIPEKELKNIYK